MVKNIIIVLGLILLLVLGYYLFVINRDSGVDSSNEIVVNRAEAETREFLQRLNELKTIELNTTILSDARFQSLVEYTEPVSTVLVGRENPFIVPSE